MTHHRNLLYVCHSQKLVGLCVDQPVREEHPESQIHHLKIQAIGLTNHAINRFNKQLSQKYLEDQAPQQMVFHSGRATCA